MIALAAWSVFFVEEAKTKGRMKAMPKAVIDALLWPRTFYLMSKKR